MNVRHKLITLALLAIAVSFGVQPAHATVATGTVAVSATVSASVSLTFVTDGSGILLGGTGTSAATISFGAVQAYGGVVPANVTKTLNGTTNWSLTTPFDVVVQVANQTSSNYTLTATLQSTDATNSWDIGATAITTTPATLTSVGTYGSTSYTFKLTIPFSAAASTISNTITFTATAN
ncbi:MAG TPA: hypothetical protein VKR82_16800 [Candidatus Acidoferrales bacterium]|nr:hypothetical protein [Candidatus Acidoferrales bacterium]